jgi:universal stress protein E
VRTEKTRYLVVIDPARNEQWALQKALRIAKNRENVEIYAFLCPYYYIQGADPSELEAAELRRHSMWLDEILAHYSETGITVKPVVEWHADWTDALLKMVFDLQIDMVIKRSSNRAIAQASSDRKLIRTLRTALLLVKHDPTAEVRKVLVAVDLNATDEEHKALNEATMNLGRQIRGADDQVELHAVSAYLDSDKFVHAPDVAKKLGIERSRAHVHLGKPGDVIPGLAKKIGADLVIVGNIGRRGLSGMTVGNTAEKILGDIWSDVLVLVREADISVAAA